MTAPFIKINEVQTVAATPSSTQLENAKANVKLTIERFHNIPEFGVVKDDPVAIVGGGPSLKRYMKDLRKFQGKIFACGSVNDYLMQNVVIPDYAVICDPDPLSLKYYMLLSRHTTYLLGSNIDPVITKHMMEHVPRILLWHCHSPDFEGKEKEVEIPYVGFNGGATVGNRTMNLAYCMGYRDFHLFGMDTSLEGNSHHAYEFMDPAVEKVGKVYSIKVGKEEAQGEAFLCEGYHIAQATAFNGFCNEVGKNIKITFHCDGLLPAYYEVIKEMMELK